METLGKDKRLPPYLEHQVFDTLNKNFSFNAKKIVHS